MLFLISPKKYSLSKLNFENELGLSRAHSLSLSLNCRRSCWCLSNMLLIGAHSFFVAMRFVFTHFFRTSTYCLRLSLYFHLLRHFGPSPAHFSTIHPPHSFCVLFINILNRLFSMQFHCASCWKQMKKLGGEWKMRKPIFWMGYT